MKKVKIVQNIYSKFSTTTVLIKKEYNIGFATYELFQKRGDCGVYTAADFVITF